MKNIRDLIASAHKRRNQRQIVAPGSGFCGENRGAIDLSDPTVLSVVLVAYRRFSVPVRHQRVAAINTDRQALRWRSRPAERDRRLVIAWQRWRNRFGYFRICLAVRHNQRRPVRVFAPGIHRCGYRAGNGSVISIDSQRVQRLSADSDKSVLLLFPACASSACSNASGNARPRFAARRRIPVQASRLK